MLQLGASWKSEIEPDSSWNTTLSPISHRTSKIPHVDKNNWLLLFCLTKIQINSNDSTTFMVYTVQSTVLHGSSWWSTLTYICTFAVSFGIKWITSTSLHCFVYSFKILWRKSVTIKGRPSLRETFGSQCSRFLALVMSGFLIWGSSAVLGLNSIVAIGSIVSFTTWKRQNGHLCTSSWSKDL